MSAQRWELAFGHTVTEPSHSGLETMTQVHPIPVPSKKRSYFSYAVLFGTERGMVQAPGTFLLSSLQFFILSQRSDEALCLTLDFHSSCKDDLVSV